MPRLPKKNTIRKHILDMSAVKELSVPLESNPRDFFKWFQNSDNIGGFFFLCFALSLALLTFVTLLFGLYYFIFAPIPKTEPKRKSIWISIADYQDKLTPKQQELYIEYACKQYEEEMMELRQRQREAMSGTMFPDPKPKPFLTRVKHLFNKPKVYPIKQLHEESPNCYFATAETIEEVEKEANRAASPDQMV